MLTANQHSHVSGGPDAPGTPQAPRRAPSAPKSDPGATREPSRKLPGVARERPKTSQGRPGEPKKSPGRPRRRLEATQIDPKSPPGTKPRFSARKMRSKPFSERFVCDVATKNASRIEHEFRAKLPAKPSLSDEARSRFIRENAVSQRCRQRSELDRETRKINDTLAENGLET